MIRVFWVNEEKTVICLDYYHPIRSWEEYQEAIDRSCAMARSVNHGVSILHYPGHTAMPAGNALDQITRAAKKTPPNVDQILMLVHNRFARRLVSSAIYIMGSSSRYKIIQSLDEAVSILSDKLSAPS